MDSRVTSPRVSLNDLYGEETADWMRLTPQQRWAETVRLTTWFHVVGGTSDRDPDPRVLSTIRRFDVPALLVGGQAWVLYGAAEYSRDVDLAVLATDDALPRLTNALQALQAAVIAVPAFEGHYLRRGHAVHFITDALCDRYREGRELGQGGMATARRRLWSSVSISD